MEELADQTGGPDFDPTISVVIPAYNEERHVGDALDSVLAQSRPPLEVIVVDDGSTDGTLEVVDRHPGDIRVIEQDNRGCPGAFDTGFRAAAGDFVALLPADDVWEPQKLEWQHEVLTAHPEVDVVFGAARTFGLVEGAFVRPSQIGLLDSASFAREMYTRNSLIPDPSAVVRRSLYTGLGGYEPLIGEDYEFWMRALRAGATFYFDPRPVVLHRVHGGNLSYRAIDIWQTNLLVHSRYPELAGDEELARKTIARDLLTIGYLRAAMGQRAEARKAFRASLEQRFSLGSFVTAATMSIPGVAGAVQRLTPRLRRAVSNEGSG